MPQSTHTHLWDPSWEWNPLWNAAERCKTREGSWHLQEIHTLTVMKANPEEKEEKRMATKVTLKQALVDSNTHGTSAWAGWRSRVPTGSGALRLHTTAFFFRERSANAGPVRVTVWKLTQTKCPPATYRARRGLLLQCLSEVLSLFLPS